MGQQGSFNLGDINPVATDFVLKILPSQVLQTAVWPQTAQVAGAVNASLCIVRVGTKGRCRCLWLPPLPQR